MTMLRSFILFVLSFNSGDLLNSDTVIILFSIHKSNAFKNWAHVFRIIVDYQIKRSFFDVED